MLTDFQSVINGQITAGIDLEYFTEMTRLIPLTEPRIISGYDSVCEKGWMDG